MALRSLDNALSLAQERPRKIAKVVTAKTAIDENSAPPANAVEASVEYIASRDLVPLDEPQKKVEVWFVRQRSVFFSLLCGLIQVIFGLLCGRKVYLE